MNKFWLYIKAHKVITGVIIVIVLIGGYFVYKKVVAGNAPTQYVLAEATTDTLITSVQGTGQVSAENQLNLTPQGSGQITSIPVKQGQSVAVGQTIAVIDEKNAEVSLAQAKAGLTTAQANYDKVVNGATASTINQSQQSITNAQTNLGSTIKSSYTQTNNLIRTDIDNFFSNPTGSSPQFHITFNDTSTNGTFNSTVTLTPSDENEVLNINAERVQIGIALTQWQIDVSASSTLDLTADAQANHAIQYLNQVKNFLSDISDAVNSVYLNQTKYQNELGADKSDIAAALNTVNTLITNIQNGQASLATAKQSLSVTTAPARAEDVASANANLQSAQASYQAALNTYNNNIVSAPFAGQIAVLNSHVGDVVSGSTVITTLTTPKQLAQISLNEVDVAKVKVGDKATLTFDALPNLTISGTVGEIDTVGIVTQGVVDYTVKIAFDTQDARVLPGMSVSASIITLTKPNVILVPSGAVKTDASGNTYVQEIPGQTVAGTVSIKATPINVQVSVGDSNDTQTEITSGLKSGDVVVVRTVTSGSVSSAATSRSIFGGGGGAARRIGG